MGEHYVMLLYSFNLKNSIKTNNNGDFALTGGEIGSLQCRTSEGSRSL